MPLEPLASDDKGAGTLTTLQDMSQGDNGGLMSKHTLGLRVHYCYKSNFLQKNLSAYITKLNLSFIFDFIITTQVN